MPNFTPGPWELAPNKPDNIKVITQEGWWIVDLNPSWYNPTANAHLIAASPFMYDALTYLKRLYVNTWTGADDWESGFRMAERALAKADGKEEK